MNKTHGMCGTPTYKSWQAMRGRCSGRLSMAKHYRDKGIVVCDRWQDFSAFLADMGKRPEGTTLDRIDSNGNYEPGNCRWATKSEQMRNKSDNVWIEHNGERLCLAEWEARTGLDHRTIRRRMALGWPVEDVLRAEKNFRYSYTGNTAAANKSRTRSTNQPKVQA